MMSAASMSDCSLGTLSRLHRSTVMWTIKGDGEVIFSRGCPEFQLTFPSRFRLLLMLNHLKSKGYGGQAESDAKRRR